MGGQDKLPPFDFLESRVSRLSRNLAQQGRIKCGRRGASLRTGPVAFGRHHVDQLSGGHRLIRFGQDTGCRIQALIFFSLRGSAALPFVALRQLGVRFRLADLELDSAGFDFAFFAVIVLSPVVLSAARSRSHRDSDLPRPGHNIQRILIGILGCP